MFFIPILCFAVMLAVCMRMAKPDGAKAASRVRTQCLMLVSAQYAVLCMVYYSLHRLAADYDGTLPLLVVFLCCILPYGALLCKGRMPEHALPGYLRKLSVAAAILVLAECFVFNLKSLSPQQQSEVLRWNQVTFSDHTEFSGEQVTIDGNAQLILYDVPAYTQGVILTAERETDRDTIPFHVVLGMKDDNFTENFETVQETWEMGRQPIALSIHPYGEIHALQIDFGDVTTPFVLTSIRCVSRLPFAFSSLRFWILLAACSLCMAVNDFEWYRIRYHRRRIPHVILVAATIVLCTGSACLFHWQAEEPIEYHGVANALDPYAMTLDAFEKHQVWLDLEADPALESIDNVYVRAQRDASGAASYWDLAYFEGRYYSYFGAAPVLTFYYPYYWITGKLPTVNMATAWFGTLSVFLSCLTILAALRIFSPHPNLILLLLSLLTASALSGAYWLMNIGGIYHLASTAGLCYLFVCLCAGFRARTVRRLPWKLVLLFVSGAALALCAGSRPTIALGAAVLIPLFVGILLYRRETWLRRILQATAFLVPLGIGAAGILWYNYARFGSALDFGASYQLTVSNINANRLFWTDLWAAVFNYFLLAPRPRSTFPFFEGQWGNLYNFQHYVYVEGTYGWLHYPFVALGALGLPRVVAGNGAFPHAHVTRVQRRIMLLICFVVPVLIAWFDFSMGGSNQRYLLDAAPLLLIGCVLVLLHCNRKPMQGKYLYRISCAALLVSYGINWLLLLGFRNTSLIRHCPDLYNTVEELVMFWQ